MQSIRIALAVVSVAAVSVTGGVSAASSSVGAAQEADIVQTAVGAGNFKTLTKLLKRAHLVRTLKQPDRTPCSRPPTLRSPRCPSGS